MLFCNRLKPDRLPYTARCRVPKACALSDLLSSVLPARFRGIKNTDDKLVKALSEVFRDVKAERKISALMSSDGFFIDINHTAPINSFKMEKRALALKAVVKDKLFPVPYIFVRLNRSLNTRKIGFGRKGNNYLAVKIPWNFFGFRSYRKIEFSVKTLPIVSDKLRSRIFRKRFFDIYFIRPSCFDMAHIYSPLYSSSFSKRYF